MPFAAPQLTVEQVLHTVSHSAFYLFLGAAFTTVGLVAGTVALLGRRFNALLAWLGVFALLYGQRLWLESSLLHILFYESSAYHRLAGAINYLVPIPAFLYFEAAGFLGRSGRRLIAIFPTFFLFLFVAALFLGYRPYLQFANNVVVILCLVTVVFQSRSLPQSVKDVVVLRGGLIVFAAFALFSNIAAAFGVYPNIEAIGFTIFLGSLGYVAIQQTQRRDRELNGIQKELEVARNIQTSILPSAYPALASFQVGTRYVPMTSVAGDFYDFLSATEDETGLLIADVSGHGVPAALIASMVKLAANAQQANRRDPAALLTGMNAALCGNTQNQFVTAAYVHLDARTATLRYAAAAHPPMLLLRGGEIVEIVENGLMLAAFPFAEYTAATLPLLPGDRLALYTDGIVEAANAKEEEFGTDRLSALLRETGTLPPQQASDRIIEAVQSWAIEQNDDLTLLVCDFPG